MGRALGAEATRGAVHNAFLSLLWRLAALRDGAPDRRDVQALAAARSTLTGQLEAIVDTTELVSFPSFEATEYIGSDIRCWCLGEQRKASTRSVPQRHAAPLSITVQQSM